MVETAGRCRDRYLWNAGFVKPPGVTLLHKGRFKRTTFSPKFYVNPRRTSLPLPPPTPPSLPESRYKYDNIISQDLDLPERTTQEYDGPGMVRSLKLCGLVARYGTVALLLDT